MTSTTSRTDEAIEAGTAGMNESVDSTKTPSRARTTPRNTGPRVTHKGRYGRNRPNDDRVVMIDIDGVLADMSPFEATLTQDDIPTRQRWREFFAHIPDAAVLAAGHDLAWAIDSLGYTLVYSSTRPSYTHAATRLWLAEQDFPAGRALLIRPTSEPSGHPQPAAHIKRSHARAVTNKHPDWLRAFIDDDPDIVNELTGHDVPALAASELTELGVASLRQRLDLKPGTKIPAVNNHAAPKSQAHQNLPKRRVQQETQPPRRIHPVHTHQA